MSAPSAIQRQVAVLGATGSIGSSALDVIARHPHRFRATLLAAGHNVGALLELCRIHRPRHAVVADTSSFAALRDGLRDLGLDTQAHSGDAVLDQLAAGPDCDTVVAAVVGAAGLSSTLAAARAGKRLLLANKESLVLAGELVMAAAQANGGEIIPIDSEHNAIFQCLRSSAGSAGIRRLLLTASGGPFRGWDRNRLADVTREQALAHPKWSMGPKISIDSATMMNKGLEVIEAHHLFSIPNERIDILVHPQSLVHSLVEFIDGSTLAQLGLPDMRTSLAVGLGWPERIESGVAGLDLLQNRQLEFEAPDMLAFPCLRLARDALVAGGTVPAILNAANEIAVSAFLQGRVGFLAIPALVETTLNALPHAPACSLESLLAADQAARDYTEQSILRGAFPA
ncbi:MAG: 1-deoxy-D-xylulose-5-phosphate reductoisomerase [Xanthomonadaceae bacterium]|jgi:1-deoxy-D-xylulose-5-phosphate reductoisomerase|nr:1-deoxy-D-xylulose-5-phosphate reductoisomerase [Xanthomonadaceae bacterium]